jgi:hypothetical protein
MYDLVTFLIRDEVDVVENVKPAVREILTRSHVAAVAIVVLLLSSFGTLVRAISKPLPGVPDYVATAVAILGTPARGFTVTDKITLIIAAGYLIDGCVALTAAWYFNTNLGLS